MISSYTYIGDVALDTPVHILFNTRSFTTGVPTSLSGSPSAVVYVDNNATELAIVALFVDWDGKIGLNRCGFTVNAANGFTVGTNCYVVLAAGTVGGASVANTVVGAFSVQDRYNGTGSSGSDPATLAAIAAVQADTDNIQTRLPAALVGGRMDASVGAMAADVLTASALAADAVAEIQTGLATAGSVAGLATAAALATVQADTDNLQTRIPAALIGGRMDSSVGAMAPDTLTASALAADAAAEIRTGLATQAGVDDLPTNAELAAALATADDAVLAQLALVKAKTDNLPPDPADASDIAASFNALGLAVADIPNNAELAAALDAIATATEVADAILRRNVAGGSDGVRTVSEALYALRNKTEIIGGFLKVYQTDDATVAWQGAVTTAPGDPLTSIDPA